MRNITVTLILGLIPLLADAQPPMPPAKMNDDGIIQMQTMDIVSRLCLDENTEKLFISEYTAFRKEIDAVARNARPPKNVNSEEEIDKAIRQNFAVSGQILQIREKYYKRFGEFLKPSQIHMMYRIENEEGRRMHHGPGGPEGPDGRREPPHGEGHHPDF